MFDVKLSASTVQKLFENLSYGYSRLELHAQCACVHVVGMKCIYTLVCFRAKHFRSARQKAQGMLIPFYVIKKELSTTA